MGNKQQLQLNNETLGSILSNVLGLPSQESLKHWAYVWKMYESGYEENDGSKYANNIEVEYGTGYSVPVTVYGGTNYNFDPLTGIYTLGGTVNSYQITATVYAPQNGDSVGTEYYHIVGGTSGEKMIKSSASDGLWATVNGGTLKLYRAEYICTSNPTKTFVDYVVSDSPTAYPDGGEQDGYWYEKVVEGIPIPIGITKFAVDKFTLSADTYFSNGVNVYPSLDVPPRIAIVISPLLELGYIYNIAGVIGDYKTSATIRSGYCLASYYVNEAKGAVTDNSVGKMNYYDEGYLAMSSGISQKFKAGVEYTLITMA